MALVALALGVVVLGGLIAAPVRAAGASPHHLALLALATGKADEPLVRAGEDVVVPAGTTTQSAVAMGGDVTVDGVVTDAAVAFGGDIVVNGSVGSSVVAFGGDVTVNGRVGASVVAFGGDVTLLPGAVVGATMKPADKTVVLFGGQLKRDPSAQVTGTTAVYDKANWTGAAGWFSRGVGSGLVRPWWGFGVVGWVIQAAICLVLGLVAAALLPRQMRAVQGQLSRRTAASLGWGALAFFVIVPAIFVVLVISVVGLLLVVPLAVFLALFYFFVITTVAALVAGLVLRGTKYRDSLVMAVVLGVLATTLVSKVPVAGVLALLVMAVFGAGAAVLAYGEHRRERRAAAPALAGAPAGPAPLPGGAVSTGAAPVDAAPPQPAGYMAPWAPPTVPPAPPDAAAADGPVQPLGPEATQVTRADAPGDAAGETAQSESGAQLPADAPAEPAGSAADPAGEPEVADPAAEPEVAPDAGAPLPAPDGGTTSAEA